MPRCKTCNRWYLFSHQCLAKSILTPDQIGSHFAEELPEMSYTQFDSQLLPRWLKQNGYTPSMVNMLALGKVYLEFIRKV